MRRKIKQKIWKLWFSKSYRDDLDPDPDPFFFQCGSRIRIRIRIRIKNKWILSTGFNLVHFSYFYIIVTGQLGLKNVSITLWSYKYFQDRFKFNHSNISLAVWFGNFFPGHSLVLQIFPWHFILQIFTGKFDHQIISKIVFCTNVSRTFWSYNCFQDNLVLQLTNVYRTVWTHVSEI